MKNLVLMLIGMVSALFALGGAGSATDVKKKIASGKASKLNINPKTGVMKKGVGTGKGLVNGNKKVTKGKGFGAPKATKKAAADANKVGPKATRTIPKRKR